MGKMKAIFMEKNEGNTSSENEAFFEWLMQEESKLFLEQRRKDEISLREKLKDIQFRKSLGLRTRIKIFLYNLRLRKSRKNTLNGRKT